MVEGITQSIPMKDSMPHVSSERIMNEKVVHILRIAQA